MLVSVIRDLNKSVPFVPYDVRLTSGQSYHVPHPDFIMVAPKGSWVMITDEQEGTHWVSSLLVEEVTPRNPPTALKLS